MRHLYTPLNQNDLSLQIPTLDHRHCIHLALSKPVMTTTIVAITTQHMLVQILSVWMEAKATTKTKTSCEHSRKTSCELSCYKQTFCACKENILNLVVIRRLRDKLDQIRT